jgi:hypothetical protein
MLTTALNCDIISLVCNAAAQDEPAVGAANADFLQAVPHNFFGFLWQTRLHPTRPGNIAPIGARIRISHPD